MISWVPIPKLGPQHPQESGSALHREKGYSLNGICSSIVAASSGLRTANQILQAIGRQDEGANLARVDTKNSCAHISSAQLGPVQNPSLSHFGCALVICRGFFLKLISAIVRAICQQHGDRWSACQSPDRGTPFTRQRLLCGGASVRDSARENPDLHHFSCLSGGRSPSSLDDSWKVWVTDR